MKFKSGLFEFDCDKDDAKIVVPIILLLMALCFIEIKKEILIASVVVYYFIFFFWQSMSEKIRIFFQKIKLKCPNCRSRKLLLQGYGTYHSSEHHAFYLCTKCNKSSILTEGGLTHE